MIHSVTRRSLVLAAAALLLATAPTFASAPKAANLAPDAAASCTRGYSPCIKNKSSDVDCYGGGGNGPRYTMRGVVYHVTGSDPYRLDSDHNHWACG